MIEGVTNIRELNAYIKKISTIGVITIGNKPWELNVYDYNDNKWTTVFKGDEDGNVYHHGKLITTKTNVTEVKSMIDTYTGYTNIFSPNTQQIYTIRHYNDEVVDGNGKHIANGGRQGLAYYLYKNHKIESSVWVVDDEQFQCDLEGYCKDATGNDALYSQYFVTIDSITHYRTQNENVTIVHINKGEVYREFFWHKDTGKVYIDEDDESHLFMTGVSNQEQIATAVAFFWRDNLVIDYYFEYLNNSAHYQFHPADGVWYDDEGNALVDDLQNYEALKASLYDQWMDRAIWTINGAEFSIFNDGHCEWADGTTVDLGDETCDIESLKAHLDASWGGVWTEIVAVHDGVVSSFTFFHNGSLVSNDPNFNETFDPSYESLAAAKAFIEQLYKCEGNVVFVYYKDNGGNYL